MKICVSCGKKGDLYWYFMVWTGKKFEYHSYCSEECGNLGFEASQGHKIVGEVVDA